MTDLVDHPDDAPDPCITQVELERVVATYEDKAVHFRAAVERLSATFAGGTEETNTERRKVGKLIEMILQHHLKTAAAAVKMLIVSILEGKPDVGVGVLRQHLTQLAAQQDGLTMVRASLAGKLKDPEKKVLTTSEEGLKQQTGLRILKPGEENRG